MTRTAAPLISLIVALAISPILAATAFAADEIVVRPGDTLSGIARRHGLPVGSLVDANGIRDPNRIFAGQRLVVPGRTAPAPAPSQEPPPAAVPAARTHVVSRGESLWGIARAYGVSLSALIAANGIANPRRIHAGLQLVIPGAAALPAPAAPVAAPPAPPPAPGAPAVRTHVVSRGESMWGIARAYGVSLSALIAANGSADPSRIRAGLQLVIPGAAPVPAAAAAPVAAPAPAAPPAMSTWMANVVAQRGSVRQLIAEEATAAGVPVPLALAVAWQESGWRQEVVSSAGAVGVMQLMPGTARWIGQAMLGRTVNVHDARDNVRAGVRLLAHYLARYQGNVDLVLAAYYQGQGAADRHGVYSSSRPYIASIAALTRLFGG